MEKIKVEAASDIDINRVKAFASKYGVPKTFTDYIDLLELKNLDLIDICSPTSTHANIACDAAKFGYDILLEKPMAKTSAECDRIIAECRKKGVMLCICHNKLFFPSVKSLVCKGYYLVRTIHSTKPSKSWVTKPEEGGMLWEEGTHQAYLQQHLLGDIEEVYAIGSKLSHPVYYDIVSLLKSSSDSYGIMELSWTREFLEDSLELYSLNGKIKRIDLSYFPKQEERAFDIYKHDIFSSTKEVIKKAVGRVRARSIKSIYSSGKRIPKGFHFDLIKAYVNSIEEGASPPVKPSKGKDAIKLLECIRSSLETGKSVQFQ